MVISTIVNQNIRKIMAKKKTRSVKETCCHKCLVGAKFKDLNRIEVPSHNNNPEFGLYGIYVCDKCLPKVVDHGA